MYGIDWNAPLDADEDDVEAVEVPAIHNPLRAKDYSELCELVDPTTPSHSYGLDQYRLTVDFVEDKLSHYIWILYSNGNFTIHTLF